MNHDKLCSPAILVISTGIELNAARNFSPFFSIHICSWKDKDRAISQYLPSLVFIDLNYCVHIKEDLLQLIQKNVPDSVKSVLFYSGESIQLVLDPHSGSIMQPIMVKLSEHQIVFELYNLLAIDPLGEFHAMLKIPHKTLSSTVFNVMNVCCFQYNRIQTYDDVQALSATPVPDSAEQFLKETGIPFSEYIRRLKIEMSRGILTNTDMTASEVSHMVGYTSYSQYLGDFKHFLGESPSEYRLTWQSRFSKDGTMTT